MKKLGENPTREELLKYISKSSSYGNLGLFVGAGFCKAVLNDGRRNIALSWGELLERSAHAMNLEYDDLLSICEGMGYPQIASQMCQAYASENRVDYKAATSKLKSEIANLTCWYPDNDTRVKFGNYLAQMSPAWVITTNYDLVIEGLLTGKSIPLGPNDQLTHPRDVVPVFHLHGVRLNPEEIIITQEDYVTLFRPNEYRQIKLALTVKESTTLFLGYGLGDVNVLTALDWSNNVFTDGKLDYPHDVIQILRKENSTEKPYRDRNGIAILEVNDIVDFFEEFNAVSIEERNKEASYQAQLDSLARQFGESSDRHVKAFIENQEFRIKTIRLLATAPRHLVSGFISLLEKSIDETWKRALPKNAFGAYNENLSIILDILTLFQVETIPPALFQASAYAFDRVAGYIGRNYGQSYAAAATWDERKGELSIEMVTELKNVSNRHRYFDLNRLLESLSTNSELE